MKDMMICPIADRCTTKSCSHSKPHKFDKGCIEGIENKTIDRPLNKWANENEPCHVCVPLNNFLKEEDFKIEL